MRLHWMHPALLLVLSLLVSHALAAERITYFVPDAAGSPVAAMDEQGNVIWRKSYKPYGEEQLPAPGTTTPSFTGKPKDPDTGLVYMGARWYDPESARFTGIDPQHFDERNPQSFGRYIYANNSPYVYYDPNGEVALPLILGIAGFALLTSPNANAPSHGDPTPAMGADGLGVGVVAGVGVYGIAEGAAALVGLAIKAPNSTTKGLPESPDELLKRGYKEVSHKDAASKGHRTFENTSTGDKVRHDKGRPGASGHEGTDHYHRYNPAATGKSDQYLDKAGNPCARGCDASHLKPGE